MFISQENHVHVIFESQSSGACGGGGGDGGDGSGGGGGEGHRVWRGRPWYKPPYFQAPKVGMSAF